MRHAILPATAIALVLAAFSSSSAAETQDDLPPAPEGKTWKLVWHDEFDGRQLDESKWDVPEGRRRDGWWSRKAISLDGQGNLVISTLKQDGKYLDGCVRTRGKFEHAFGYYVDGKETWRTDAGGGCQVPLYIKLSDEIGKWGGDITKARLPDRFVVDYVRVYDLKEE